MDKQQDTACYDRPHGSLNVNNLTPCPMFERIIVLCGKRLSESKDSENSLRSRIENLIDIKCVAKYPPDDPLDYLF